MNVFVVSIPNESERKSNSEFNMDFKKDFLSSGLNSTYLPGLKTVMVLRGKSPV